LIFVVVLREFQLNVCQRSRVFFSNSLRNMEIEGRTSRGRGIYVKDKVQAQSRRETSVCFLVNEGILERIVDTDSRERPRLSDAR
jgi:hypothetical protein